jgi:transcriptional regulator with XRE-family HTH domain
MEVILMNEWLKKLRKEKGLTIMELIEDIPVSESSVSRIETSESSPLLETSVFLATRLRAPEDQLYQMMTGQVVRIPDYEISHPNEAILDFQSLENLLDQINENLEIAKNVITDLLNEIYIRQIRSLSYYGENPPPQKVFAPNYVDLLLYALEMQSGAIDYPQNRMSLDYILFLLEKGSVITRDDFITYLFTRNEESGKKVLTQYELDRLPRLTPLSYTRSGIGGMKLHRLVQIDQKLGGQGEIFLLGWRACLFEIWESQFENVEKSFAPFYPRIGKLLIHIYRMLGADRGYKQNLTEVIKSQIEHYTGKYDLFVNLLEERVKAVERAAAQSQNTDA